MDNWQATRPDPSSWSGWAITWLCRVRAAILQSYDARADSPRQRATWTHVPEPGARRESSRMVPAARPCEKTFSVASADAATWNASGVEQRPCAGMVVWVWLRARPGERLAMTAGMLTAREGIDVGMAALLRCVGYGPVAQRERASLAWKRSGVRFPSGPPKHHFAVPTGFFFFEQRVAIRPDPVAQDHQAGSGTTPYPHPVHLCSGLPPSSRFRERPRSRPGPTEDPHRPRSRSVRNVSTLARISDRGHSDRSQTAGHA